MGTVISIICPNCGSKQTYARTKTNDYRCHKCAFVFSFNPPAPPESQPPKKPLPKPSELYDGSAGEEMGFWKKPKYK